MPNSSLPSWHRSKRQDADQARKQKLITPEPSESTIKQKREREENGKYETTFCRDCCSNSRAAGAFAQNIVKGTVKDARTGEPIIGASVKYVGQKTGVITDVDGHFKLDVKSLPSTLKVNYLGYHDFNIDVYDNEEPIEISLTENRNLLESVVVLGYTQVKRQNLTGSVSTVKGNDATSIAASSFNEQIQGQAPGLIVSSSSGTPGSATFVRLRGTTSINAGNDPLYIIDGVPINSTALQTISNGGQTVNPLSDLNPNDIENIEVLKDASATAVYGARGANGVILVTTKRGKRNQKTRK